MPPLPDKLINQLPSVLLPLTGIELLPVQQGGVTTQLTLQQLANSPLFPAPGPGTDPLALTHGLTVHTLNANVLNSGSDAVAVDINCTTDSTATDPQFTDENALQVGIHATHGQNNYNAHTQSKKTFLPFNTGGTFNAAGQRFGMGITINSYGMGDSACFSNLFHSFAGGPTNGDEGQCWAVVADMHQQSFLNVTTITSVPTQATLNTTTTQPITASKSIQTITVASSAGANVGDWVIVEQEVPATGINLESVQLTAVGPGTISGIFVCNHVSGVTITPALRLFVVSSFQMGQDRVLVNMSQPSYSTGTVTAPTGPGTTAAFTGSGTTWTNSMVGGNALNIGAVTLANDDYTFTPFDSGANRLRSWYQIVQVTSPTNLVILSNSVAGDTSYKGKGCGAGAYVIRPCARVLRIIHSGGTATGEIICETSTSTWTVGDTVEQIICPYPDVTGFQYHLSSWTNGGTYRGFMDIRNDGARTFDTCIYLGEGGGVVGQPSADVNSWASGIQIDAHCNIGFRCTRASQLGLMLNSPANFGGITDSASRIGWDPTVGLGYIGYNSTNIGPEVVGIGAFSKLQWCQGSTGVNTDPQAAVILGPAPAILGSSVFKAVPITFSQRPNPASTGMMVCFSDATVNTWGTSVTGGGGTNKVLSWYNGTNWTVIGA